MDVVWSAEPIRGRGGEPSLLDDPDLRPFGYAAPWEGLRCDHHARGRVEWTPFVIRWGRRADGARYQDLLFRLPAIRSCCVADDFRRAAWWHDVEWAVRVWGEADGGSLADELAAHRAAILHELRAVIPRPTPAALRDFAAFRADRDAEDASRDRANRAFWEALVRQDADQRWRQARSGAGFGAGPRPGGIDPGLADCFAVLRLPPDATLAQVRARHRALAMIHHPDRGGDPAEFLVVQDAYERASALIRSRSGR